MIMILDKGAEKEHRGIERRLEITAKEILFVNDFAESKSKKKKKIKIHICE